jgi:hypothetical protein
VLKELEGRELNKKKLKRILKKSKKYYKIVLIFSIITTAILILNQTFYFEGWKLKRYFYMIGTEIDT